MLYCIFFVSDPSSRTTARPICLHWHTGVFWNDASFVLSAPAAAFRSLSKRDAKKADASTKHCILNQKYCTFYPLQQKCVNISYIFYCYLNFRVILFWAFKGYLLFDNLLPLHQLFVFYMFFFHMVKCLLISSKYEHFNYISYSKRSDAAHLHNATDRGRQLICTTLKFMSVQTSE